MANIAPFLNFTVQNLLDSNDTSLLSFVLQQVQANSVASQILFSQIQSLLSGDESSTETVETVTQSSAADVYSSDYDNCKWGFIFMNTSFPDASFDYETTCCFDTLGTGNDTIITQCFDNAYNMSGQVPTGSDLACRVVRSREIPGLTNLDYTNPKGFSVYNQFNFLKWLPLLAVLLVISFALTTRRRSTRKSDCCGGFIGLPKIINMLDNERTRFINASIFFAFGYQLYLMSTHPLFVDLPYYELKRDTIGFLAKKLIIICYFLVVYAPIAMGIARYDFYGSMVAILYTWMITIHHYTRDYACAVDGLTWVYKVPEHLAWTLLSILIPALAIKVALIDIPSKKKSVIGRFNERYVKFINGYDNWRKEPYYDHTVDLCRSARLRTSSRSIIARQCWDPRNIFKFHSRLLSIVTAAFIVIWSEVFIYLVLVTPAVQYVSNFIIQSWETFAPFIILIDQFFQPDGTNRAERITEYISIIQKYIAAVPLCLNIAIIVAILLTLFNLYRMLINYREHCAQVIKGDYSEVHVANRTNVNLMTGNLKYQAYQTAYIGVGFIIQLFLCFVVFLLISWLFVLPLAIPIIPIKDFIIEKLKGAAPTIGYLIGMILLQNIVVRFVILQDQNLNTAIDNRRVYNLFAYFFFFNVCSLSTTIETKSNLFRTFLSVWHRLYSEPFTGLFLDF